jgi:hypothetical protein
MNAKQIIGPILYAETINTNTRRYVRLILTEFFAQLTEENDRMRGFSRIQQVPTPQTILLWFEWGVSRQDKS